MEYGFSILMFCFAGALLLYAGLLAAEKRRPDLLIPRFYASAGKVGNARRYARRIAKIVALCALSPLLTGLVGLTGQYLIAGIVFVVTLAGAIWLGVKMTSRQKEDG